MEQFMWTTTPVKNKENCDYSMSYSPILHKTPVKRGNEAKFKQKPHTNNFSILPNHFTPPSGLTKFIARNPFESDLTNRLHLSVISPTVFSKISSPSQDSPNFKWSVDDLAVINPAKIDEFQQQVHTVDPETESKAQAAIDKFFEQNSFIPSPWDTKKPLPLETDTPVRAPDASNLNQDGWKLRREGSSQTILSLPPELPSDVEAALKPYYTFTQEHNGESDDANSSTNSLRRKLFFNLEEDNSDISICSPVKMDISLTNLQSPQQSGMLVDGTPIKKCGSIVRRNHGTPMANYGNPSPPNVSPILDANLQISCETYKSRSRSVARLDFSKDMSVDTSSYARGINGHDSISDTPSESQRTNDECQDTNDKVNEWMYKETKQCIITRSMRDKIENISNQNDAGDRLKHWSNLSKNNIIENLTSQKLDTFLGVSDYQSVNLAQDTGYQTYSMNSVNTTANNENTHSTPVKQTFLWEDKISTPEDDIRLSDWKQNMNMFSSTPSKCNQERNNQACA